jgi:WD40 repeat protein
MNVNPAPLVIGEQGRVSPGDSNNVRAIPTVEGALVGKIPGEEVFTVLDGPECNDGYAWWQVDYNGLVGWTVDGSGGETFLFPVTADIQPSFVLTPNVITRDNVNEVVLLREISCESGPDLTRTIALSPNQRYIALDCGGESGNAIAVYDLAEDRQIVTIPSERYAKSMQFSTDSTELLIQKERDLGLITMQSWDIATGELRWSISSRGYDVVAFTSDMRMLSQRLGAFEVLDLNAQAILNTISTNVETISSAWNINPDGSLLAAVKLDADSPGVVWDVQTGEVVSTFTTNFIIEVQDASVEFTPDSQQVAVGGCPQITGEGFFCGYPEIQWVDVATGERLRTWEVPQTDPGGNNDTTVSDMDFSPDGKLLVTASYKRVFLYDVDSGDLLREIVTRSFDVIFSADGTFFVTAGDTEHVFIWGIP